MRNFKAKITIAGLTLVLSTHFAYAQSDRDNQAAPASVTAKPDLGNLRTFFELARADIKTQKALVIAENLPLTDDEAVEFWPLHREYEAELSKLNDQKFALIMRYAHEYDTMNDQEAGVLAKGTLDLEEKKTALKRKYFKRFQKVLPATKAARFFQIENQLNMVLDLQVAASLPLIK
jgi:hypothetical protein